jgi:site-specific DNA-methyltransferase (adenine-specific)
MTTYRNTVLVGDALAQLRTLPDGVIDCVVTSPPYFGLRDYGVVGQLGQEAEVDAWANGIRDVCRELFRVLAPHGSLWLNLGDAFSNHVRFGARPSPERAVSP